MVSNDNAGQSGLEDLMRANDRLQLGDSRRHDFGNSNRRGSGGLLEAAATPRRGQLRRGKVPPLQATNDQSRKAGQPVTTRRERMEARLEKREEWAASRMAKSASLLRQNEPFRGDIAFNTQPGHIPERARAIRRSEKAAEHYGMAQHHEQVAATLADRLAPGATVFSDDSDAVQALEARIAEREAECDRIKAYNATCKKAAKEGRPVGDLSLLSEAQRRDLLTTARVASYQLRAGGAFPAYALSNLRARINTDRERIATVRQQQGRQQAAEQAGGLSIVRHPANNWCVLTFAEKPEREILDALRSAGYRWGGGSWHGYLDKLPACVGEAGPAPAAPVEADPERFACPDGASCSDPACIAENVQRGATTTTEGS